MAASMLVAPFAAGVVSLTNDLVNGASQMFDLWAQGKIFEGFSAMGIGFSRGLTEGLAAFAGKLVPLLQFAQDALGTRPIGAPPITAILNQHSRYILTLKASNRLALMNAGYEFMKVIQHCESFISIKSTFESEPIPIAQSAFGPLSFPVTSCYLTQSVKTYSIKIMKRRDSTPEECQDSITPPDTNLNFGEFKNAVTQCKGVPLPPSIPENI